MKQSRSVARWLLRIFAFIAILFSLAAAGLWLTAESNDFDRPFVNNGKENDLKVVGNVDQFYVYPDTHICQELAITPQAFYHMFGSRHAKFYFDDKFIQTGSILPNTENMTVSAKGSKGGRIGSLDYSFCTKNSDKYRNIYTTLRIVLVKAPDTFGVWLRARRGEEHITSFHQFKSSAEDLGHGHPYNGYIAKEVRDSISEARSQITKSLEIDPSILIIRKEEAE